MVRRELPRSTPSTAAAYKRRLNYARIAPGYFATLRIRLLRGRDFTRSDTASAPPVAIVNETMARRYWPDGNAVGAKIRRRESVMEVVGVARDAKYAQSRRACPSPSCTSRLRRIRRTISRSRSPCALLGDPLALREPIQREVRALIPSWPAFQFRTLDEGLELQQQLPRFSATLLGVLGSLGLLLAAVGLYGVMTYVVGQRTHEIGIRLALGSPVVRVMTLVVKQGMTSVVAGAAVGMAAAMAVSQLLTSVLVRSQPCRSADARARAPAAHRRRPARLLPSRPARRSRESARGFAPRVKRRRLAPRVKRSRSAPRVGLLPNVWPVSRSPTNALVSR